MLVYGGGDGQGHCAHVHHQDCQELKQQPAGAGRQTGWTRVEIYFYTQDSDKD